MAKQKHLKQPKINSSGKVDISPAYSRLNYDDFAPAFSFEYVQKDYCISKWQSNDIRKLIAKLAVLETKTWTEIKIQRLFDFKIVDKTGLKVVIPESITPETSIYYFKPLGHDSPFRIFGIKDRHNFKFIWFDKNHSVYP